MGFDERTRHSLRATHCHLFVDAIDKLITIWVGYTKNNLQRQKWRFGLNPRECHQYPQVSWEGASWMTAIIKLTVLQVSSRGGGGDVELRYGKRVRRPSTHSERYRPFCMIAGQMSFSIPERKRWILVAQCPPRQCWSLTSIWRNLKIVFFYLTIEKTDQTYRHWKHQ